MDIINRRPGLAVLVAFIAGLIIGLVVLGWGLFPVKYTGADPSGLFPEYQAVYVRNAADLYAFNNNQQRLVDALGGWGGDTAACELVKTSLDPAEQQRLMAAATLVNSVGCGVIAPPGSQATAPGAQVLPPAGAATAIPGALPDKGGSSKLPAILLGLLLLLLAVAIYYVWNRRRVLAEGATGDDLEYRDSSAGQKSGRSPFARFSAAPAASTAAEPLTVPIARFRTAYTRGHDTYDDSFSIENAGGDFLGECGVGISEVIGTTTPKNVTAFEVWLFDKNDIRTITKVIMSDHAYFDEALKAKLAPKGEPVLAREDETIVLETATLIINAEITEMDYGESSDMPDASYFDRFTIELSAWTKEGEHVAERVPGESDVLGY